MDWTCGLDMGAQLSKVVNVKMLLCIHRFVKSLHPLWKAQSKNKKVTHMVWYYWEISVQFHSLRIASRHILCQINCSFLTYKRWKINIGLAVKSCSQVIRSLQPPVSQSWFKECQLFCHIASVWLRCVHKQSNARSCPTHCVCMCFLLGLSPPTLFLWTVSVCSVCLWEWFVCLSGMIHIHCTACHMFRHR